MVTQEKQTNKQKQNIIFDHNFELFVYATHTSTILLFWLLSERHLKTNAYEIFWYYNDHNHVIMISGTSTLSQCRQKYECTIGSQQLPDCTHQQQYGEPEKWGKIPGKRPKQTHSWSLGSVSVRALDSTLFYSPVRHVHTMYLLKSLK